jgi:3'(2'), 5'-bisphosphate nucleotidase
MDDAQLATAVAKGAGAILLQLRETNLFSGKALGAAGDALAQRFIASALAEHRPGDPVLSEESADSAARLSSERVWIIDPLDGTREYSEGRPDWAVHVALAVGGRAEVGCVALPARGLLLSSGAAKVLPPTRLSKPRIVVSRTRPPAEADKVAQLIGATTMAMGSCGAKAMAIILGEADIYLHSGGQYEWDSCAPVAVAQACGFHCSRLDGTPLIYNREDSYIPDLLICRQELRDPVLSALGCESC